jgi:hypothetical protein
MLPKEIYKIGSILKSLLFVKRLVLGLNISPHLQQRPWAFFRNSYLRSSNANSIKQFFAVLCPLSGVNLHGVSNIAPKRFANC